MAESADDPELFWVDPKRRGILPLDGFHVPRRLQTRAAARRLRGPLRHRLRGGDPGLRRGRAKRARRPGSTTRSCGSTPRCSPRGAAHSVECWHDGELVGGLYGVSLGGGVFRREHVQPRHRRQQGRAGASGGAAAARRLPPARHPVRDAHLAQFGAVEISRARYHRLLAEALRLPRRSLPATAVGLSVEAAARRRRRRAGAFAFEQRDVVDRVLERRQRRARREHPAAEQRVPAPRPAASRRSRERRRFRAGPRARCFSQSRTSIEQCAEMHRPGRPAPRTATRAR